MCQQALPAIRIGRRAAQIRRRLEEGKPMDYEPLLPKDLLKGASKLSKEEAAKVIDEELSKPKPRSGQLITTPQMSLNTHPSQAFQPSPGVIFAGSGTLLSDLPNNPITITTTNPFLGSAGSGSLGQF